MSGKRTKITHIESKDLGTEPNRDVIELGGSREFEEESARRRPSLHENLSSPVQDEKAPVVGSVVHTPGAMVAQYTPAGKDSAKSATLRQLQRDRSDNLGAELSLPQIQAKVDGHTQKVELHSSRLNLKHYQSRNADDELVRMRERRLEKKSGLQEIAQTNTNELKVVERGHL